MTTRFCLFNRGLMSKNVIYQLLKALNVEFHENVYLPANRYRQLLTFHSQHICGTIAKLRGLWALQQFQGLSARTNHTSLKIPHQTSSNRKWIE